jgi:hypothetical protein
VAKWRLRVNADQKIFLELVTLPARLNIQQAAWFLGFAENDITVLIANKLLKPLGTPAPTGSKFFAVAALQMLREDTHWLAKASDAIVRHWRSKNSSRKKPNIGVVEVKPECGVRSSNNRITI